MYSRILFLACAVMLSACGGGGRGTDVSPSVSQIQAQNLRYGQITTITVAGKYMRSDMTASTGSCINPTFSTTSTPDVAVLSCKVTATGLLPISINAANGAVLYTTILTVLQPQVTLLTSKGNIVVELNPTAASNTVNNFLSYVNSGYYRSTLFHRVIPGFVIQAGGYTTGLVNKPGKLAPIVLESNNGLTNVRGSLAMARTEVFNSATSEFFVNLVNNTALDYKSADAPGYAVFGKVVSGLDVVDAIAAVPTGDFGGVPDVPTADVTISLAVQTQ
jgi:cyclophilin family peptidyl-prolyl cis-trans isomerase